MKKQSNRREFLGTAASVFAGALLGANRIFAGPGIIDNFGKPKSLIRGVQLGVITYSFRDMPDQSAEATLQYILDSGISAVELMGGPAEGYAGAPKNTVDMRTVFPLRRKRNEKKELSDEETRILADADEKMKAYRNEISQWRAKAPMEKFAKLAKMYKKAGVKIYAFKPDAFGVNSTDIEILYGMYAAKTLGASHVTLEHPANDAHTLRLGQLAQKVGVKVGYHGHEQQTHQFWDTALAQSPANMLNLDFGHFVAAGNNNPLDILVQKHERIASMHLKDRQTKTNGGGNLAWGQGNTPIKEALTMIRDHKYGFPVTVEYEYQTPQGSNAVAEVKKCIDFCKNILG
jgi:sugar phosphate isomerase/epimerase